MINLERGISFRCLSIVFTTDAGSVSVTFSLTIVVLDYNPLYINNTNVIIVTMNIVFITTAIVLVMALLTTTIAIAEGKNAYIYAYLHGKIPYSCLNHPELYVRISDSKADPKTGQHPYLVGKVTIDNPSLLKYRIVIPVDPVAFKQKYGFAITSLREYIQVLQHDSSGKDVVVWQEYSHPYTLLSASEYKWSHSIPAIC